MEYASENFSGSYKSSFEGLINNLSRRYRETTSDFMKSEIERFMKNMPCESCGGKRLKKEALAVTGGTGTLYQICEYPIDKLGCLLERLGEKLSQTELLIADRILKEIKGKA